MQIHTTKIVLTTTIMSIKTTFPLGVLLLLSGLVLFVYQAAGYGNENPTMEVSTPPPFKNIPFSSLDASEVDASYAEETNCNVPQT